MAEKPFVDIMLDIETLGTCPGSVVLSAALVRFSDLVGHTWRFSIPDQLILGLRVDPETQQWWSKQSASAWVDATSAPHGLHICLAGMSAWIKEQKGDASLRIWSHGAAFDVPVMEELYRRAGFSLPWTYREVYCARTLYKLTGTDLKPYYFGVAHSAFDDAVTQATAAAAALQKLSAVPA